MIPEENQGFKDRGRVPESRELLFLHISSRFCLCDRFPSLFHCLWARPAGAGFARRPCTTSAQRPQKATHNVYTTSRTTSAQRLHNVRTTFPGLIPKENQNFEDQGRVPESRKPLFSHISGKQDLSFCRYCQPKAGSEKQDLSSLSRLSATS